MTDGARTLLDGLDRWLTDDERELTTSTTEPLVREVGELRRALSRVLKPRAGMLWDALTAPTAAPPASYDSNRFRLVSVGEVHLTDCEHCGAKAHVSCFANRGIEHPHEQRIQATARRLERDDGWKLINKLNTFKVLPCARCNGDGEINPPMDRHEGEGADTSRVVTCPTCGGSGLAYSGPAAQARAGDGE